MELLLQQSVARQVRVLVVEQLPLVTVLSTTMVTLLPQQASIAVAGVNVHGWPKLTVKFEAQVITGATVSTTETTWLHVAELPQQSVAFQVRVTIRGQRLPALVMV